MPRGLALKGGDDAAGSLFEQSVELELEMKTSELGDSRRLKQGPKPDLDIEISPNPRYGPNRAQECPPISKKFSSIPTHSRSKHIRPNSRKDLFDRGRGAMYLVRTSGLAFGGWQGLAIDLSIFRQRQNIEPDKGRQESYNLAIAAAVQSAERSPLHHRRHKRQAACLPDASASATTIACRTFATADRAVSISPSSIR